MLVNSPADAVTPITHKSHEADIAQYCSWTLFFYLATIFDENLL